MNIMRTGIKVLLVVVGVGAAGIVADWRLSASPSPVNSTKADSPPWVEVVRPRRATVAQHLQTNATLEAFEEADLFAKVSGYLSDVRVDIGDHVKAGQVLAVIDVPEMAGLRLRPASDRNRGTVRVPEDPLPPCADTLHPAVPAVGQGKFGRVDVDADGC